MTVIPDTVHHLAFEAIGTHWEIDCVGNFSDESWIFLEKEVHDKIKTFDRTYSRFLPESYVSTISKSPGIYQLPSDGYPLFSLYESLYRQTKGMFTPMIGTVLEEAGYDSSYRLKGEASHSPPPWEETLSLTPDTISIHIPTMLDVGAAGKGYLIDLVAKLLQEHGVTEGTVDAGGDIIHWTATNSSLEIGLEDPNHLDQVIGVATIHNESICGSAGNRRSWGKYHHIINPKTLESPRLILATWVIAESTMLADAISTSLFFVEPATLSTQYKFSYLMLYQDYSVQRSPDFPVKLFTGSEFPEIG